MQLTSKPVKRDKGIPCLPVAASLIIAIVNPCVRTQSFKTKFIAQLDHREMLLRKMPGTGRGKASPSEPRRYEARKRTASKA